MATFGEMRDTLPRTKGDTSKGFREGGESFSEASSGSDVSVESFSCSQYERDGEQRHASMLSAQL